MGLAHLNAEGKPFTEQSTPHDCRVIPDHWNSRGGRTCPFRCRWEKEDRASLREPEDSAAVSSKASRIWFICTFAYRLSALTDT